jgi:hypothetical protein
MAARSNQVDAKSDPAALLLHWLRRLASPEAVAWLEGQIQAMSDRPGNRDLFIAMGLISRHFSRSELRLEGIQLASADRARPGWDPRGWSPADAARILILVEISRHEADFPRLFRELCRTAEVSEAVAFYRGLPLYDHAAALEDQAAEGARSNMRAVFEAVAHRNPYPREYFDEPRWNHMILKALFVGSSLSPVQGLEERNNPRLATMLCDFAHERWAAGRTVPPELWRCVGPFADDAAMADLDRLLESGSGQERQAAVLALASSSHPGAKSRLEAHDDLSRQAASGALSWEGLMSRSAAS